MELAQKETWIVEAHRLLLERRRKAERRLLRLERAAVRLATCERCAALAERIRGREALQYLELRNVAWALQKLEAGETF